MKFLLFCVHEGQERYFMKSGETELGGEVFTVLECCTCHDEIAFPGRQMTQEVMV